MATFQKPLLAGFMASAFALAAVAGGPAFAEANSKAARQREASDLVAEALQREIHAQGEDRDALLLRAVQAAPDYAPAHWHRGELHIDGQWRDVSSAIATLENDRRLAKYRFLRSQQDDSAERHAKIAQWCGERGLAEQEKAHWTRVLAFAPDHAEARRRLGFRRVGDVWLLAADIEAIAERSQHEQAALAKWRPQVEEIRDGLRRHGLAKRAGARERALAIGDPAAIGALEAVLSAEQESDAELLIDVLAGMPQVEATSALARQAVFSPFSAIRERAAKALSVRREDDYVPALLASMFTPTAVQGDVQWTPDGRLLYRQAFTREGADFARRLTLDTVYTRNAASGVSDVNGEGGAETLSRAVSDAWTTSRLRKWRVEDADRATSELNERIAAALNIALNQTLPVEPEAWWSWWNDRNEVFVQGEKPVLSQQLSQAIVVQDAPSATERTPSFVIPVARARVASGNGGRRLDCLAPGTTIVTSAGNAAIEKIQVGDLVLAQDPTSGELAFKPVLATTVRPAGELIRLRLGDSSIAASGGHPFWVSGEGWVKARDLEPGMVLHTAAGPATLSLVEAGEISETHNLIVADFHNYFVGDHRVLSHDNTVRRATSAVVPGLLGH